MLLCKHAALKVTNTEDKVEIHHVLWHFLGYDKIANFAINVGFSTSNANFLCSLTTFEHLE